MEHLISQCIKNTISFRPIQAPPVIFLWRRPPLVPTSPQNKDRGPAGGGGLAVAPNFDKIPPVLKDRPQSGVTGSDPPHGEAAMDHIATYQKHHISFFPLRKKNKKPIGEWTTFMSRPPSEEEVADWRSKKLLGQVAIVTGQVSGYIVLDEDEPPAFRAWLAEHNYHLPATATVKTSTYQDDQGNTHQKFHYYFKHPGGKIKNMIKQIPGADIKADGGYAVAPPSIHPSGEQYEWCFALGLDDYGDTAAPPWLIERLNYDTDSTVVIAKDDLLGPEENWVNKAMGEGVSKGERNVMAARLAGYYLGKGLPEPTVLIILDPWNQRNAPPLSAKELHKTIASIAKKEKLKRISNGQATQEDAVDPSLPWEEQRQALLRGMGERLGLPLTDIRITKSDDSVVEFFLGEADSVVMTMAQLCEQRLFKSRFVAAGLLVPRKVKESKEGGVWDEMVRQIIRLATVQDVGQESSTLGELREFLNSYVENYRHMSYFPPSKEIPHHVTFFIIQRKGEKPSLYARVAEMFQEAKNYGYKSIKKLTILLPSLGHEPEKFKWNRRTVRAWKMDLDNMSPDIKEMVFKKAMEGKDREDYLQDKN